jgi:hypothetical protein
MGFSPSRLMGFPHQPNSARFDLAIFGGDSPCPEAAPPDREYSLPQPSLHSVGLPLVSLVSY